MIAAASVRLLSRRTTSGETGPRIVVLSAVLALLGCLLAISPAAAAPTRPHATATRPHTAPARPPAAPARVDTPLAVTIRTMTPSTLPRRGTVSLTGEITNRSESTWTDLDVYMFVSPEPMTTSSELAEATGSDPDAVVGSRLAAPGLYDEVPDLAPGESTTYSVSVPRRLLPRGTGVYWIGVHVLGTNEDGRVDGADGRARTFIASMPPRGPQSTVSLVVPFRAPVRRDPDGRVAHLDAWSRALADEGRLTRLLELVEDADVPLSLLVDPAVPDAVRSLAAGNPAFDVSPTDGSGSQSAAPEAPATEEPGPVEEGTEEGAPDDVTELSPEAQQAADWLTSFTDVGSRQAVLALPYGDLDVAAVLRHGGERTYRQATELSAATLEELGLSGDPVVAPPGGLLPSVAVERLPAETRLLLSERAADTEATSIRLGADREALLTSDVARVGGPAPTPAFDALAMRQRILAEASVHALAGATDQNPDPLVVWLPERWDPGPDADSASFFTGLDVPWLRLADSRFVRAMSAGERYDEELRYPRAQRRRELPAANVEASRRLRRSGVLLAELLTRNDTIDEQVARAAMLTSSVHARRAPAAARQAAERLLGEIRSQLSSVSVESSSLVTMSSETGAFQVTLVNGLEEPITVGVEVTTDSPDLEIRSPDRVSLGPGQRGSVRLSVTSSGSGVHSVRIVPTTEEGHRVGQSTRVALRSSQVGLVIWAIMGIGAVVFVAAIAARIVRRVRRRRTAPSPEEEDALT